jgi:alanyl-tRNA synthetase
MGFERLCMAMQNVTRLWYGCFTLISKVEEITELKYTSNEVKTYEEQNNKHCNSCNIDHVRDWFASLTDGCRHTGAGYVIRRILRRAIRFYFLDYKEPFIWISSCFSKIKWEIFPEIKTLVTNVIREEEASFLRTLIKDCNYRQSNRWNRKEVNGAKHSNYMILLVSRSI